MDKKSVAILNTGDRERVAIKQRLARGEGGGHAIYCMVRNEFKKKQEKQCSGARAIIKVMDFTLREIRSP